MEQSSYTIRAAALERLVNNIILMFEKLRSSVIDETSEIDEEPFEGLEELKSLYPNSGFAVAFFPTENLEVILRSIMTIIHMYNAFPQIHGKIETCYCLQKILTKSDEVFRKLQTTVAPQPGYSISEDRRDGDIQALLGAAESQNKRGLGVFRKLQTPAALHPGQALLGAAEIKELSAWFYDVSQKVNGKTYNASVIFVKKTDNGFHPESDFAECTVNFVE